MLRLMLLLAVANLSCESIVDLEIRPDTAVLVLTSTAVAAEPWTLVLQASQPFGRGGDQAGVQDGTVVATREDGLVIEFVHLGGGLYLADGHQPTSGSSYHVTAESAGFDRVSGTFTVPGPGGRPELVSTETVDSGVRIAIRLPDGSGERNYYAIAVLDETSYQPRPFHVLNPGLQDQLKDLIGPDLLSPQTGSRLLTKALFEDSSFPDGAFDLILEVPFLLGTPVTVSVQIVSDDLFDYRRAVIMQRSSEGTPFLEPVSVPSNVHGGLGVLGGVKEYRLGALTNRSIVTALTGSYQLSGYEVHLDGTQFDYASTGDVRGEINLSSSLGVTGTVEIGPLLNGAAHQIDVSGGYTIEGGVLRFYLFDPSVLSKIDFNISNSDGWLRGSSQLNLANRVFVSFSKSGATPSR